MDSGNTRVTLVATLLILALSAGLFISIINQGGSDMSDGFLDISSLSICGNSTDILYPELMRADFVLVGQEWSVNARFLNDSLSSMNPEIYQCNFTISREDLRTLLAPLLQGIESANTSAIDVRTVLESSPSIAWQIDISFTDGSWIHLTVWLTVPYIFLLNGTDTPNHNLLDALVLQPVSVLDPLVLAINEIFANHLG